MNDIKIRRKEELVDIIKISIDGTYAVAAPYIVNHLSLENVLSCVENLVSINETENRTIETLKESGELSEYDMRVYNELKEWNINAERLMVSESKEVLRFITSNEEDIVNEKINRIGSLLSLHLNGMRNRRDWLFDQEKSETLENLLEKISDFQNGKKVSSDFDMSLCPKDLSIEEFNNLVSIFDTEELVELGYLDEDNLYEFGNITRGDLADISYFISSSWTSLSSRNQKDRLGNIINSLETKKRRRSAEDEICQSYIVDLVIPSRTLSAKNIILILASFGIECNNEYFLNIKAFPEEIRSLITDLRSILKYCSHYASRICNMRVEDLEKYRMKRPFSIDYYEELIEKVEGWKKDYTERVTMDHLKDIISLENHLFDAQILFMDIKNILNNNTNNPFYLMG